jgi:hypothetical protein
MAEELTLEQRVAALEDRHKDNRSRIDQLWGTGAQNRGKKLAQFEIDIHDLQQRLEAVEIALRGRGMIP